MKSSWVLGALLLAACGSSDGAMPPDAVVPDDAAPDANIGTPSIEGTPVETFTTTSCSTASVMGLSAQIAQEVDCLVPGQLVPFMEVTNLQFTGGAVLPYVAMDAKTDLLAAVAAGGGKIMQINSAFRTVPQQYLLSEWNRLNRCNITITAVPGNSNHESGRAVDIANYSMWITVMEAHGWAHDVPGDDVHFDHTASPDIRGQDVLAFQRLWNRNAPDDQIAEDGNYGPMTEARVKMAPAEGFGIGALCAEARLLPPPIIRLDGELERD
ncbi:MAG TPA: M15 family metallopeptidase [Kofleriaceae bacterium]